MKMFYIGTQRRGDGCGKRERGRFYFGFPRTEDRCRILDEDRLSCGASGRRLPAVVPYRQRRSFRRHGGGHHPFQLHGGRSLLGRCARADRPWRAVSSDHPVCVGGWGPCRLGRIVSDSLQKPHGLLRHPRRVGRCGLRRRARDAQRLCLVGDTDLRFRVRCRGGARRLLHWGGVRKAEHDHPGACGRGRLEFFPGAHLHHQDGRRHRQRASLHHILADGKSEQG